MILFGNMCRCRFDNEDEERIETSFGSLFLSVLTMAYAMVGLFDPEVRTLRLSFVASEI